MIFSRSFAKATVNGVRTECTEPCVDFCSFKTGNHRRHTRCYGRHNFFQDRQPLKFSVFLFLSIDMSLKAHPTRATFTCHMTWRPREPDVHVLQTSTDQVVLYRTCGWISAWSALSKQNVFSTRTCYRKLTAIPRQAGHSWAFDIWTFDLAVAGSMCFAFWAQCEIWHRSSSGCK